MLKKWRPQTAPIPNSADMAIEPTPGTLDARKRSRCPRRHEEEQEPFGLTFRCWKCRGWSAGSRRASRLKDPCGFPSKTEADVVYRVSGGYPPKAHLWRSDDASGAPERIPIIKNPCSKRYRAQVLIQDDKFHVSCNCLLCQFCWSSADQGVACCWRLSQVVAVFFSCPLAKCA